MLRNVNFVHRTYSPLYHFCRLGENRARPKFVLRSSIDSCVMYVHVMYGIRCRRQTEAVLKVPHFSPQENFSHVLAFLVLLHARKEDGEDNQLSAAETNIPYGNLTRVRERWMDGGGGLPLSQSACKECDSDRVERGLVSWYCYTLEVLERMLQVCEKCTRVHKRMM